MKEEYMADTAFPTILKPYFESLKIGVFDIETTGLSPEYCSFVLGGIVSQADGADSIYDGELTAEQYFAENLDDERAALEACMQKLEKLDVVVTFNGERFDIPFIKRRLKEYGLEDKYDIPYNFDLYRMINKFSELRKVMPNLKQKTVENFFGLWSSRSDEISGAESVELYEQWVCYGEQAVLDKILLHNLDDIKQLERLVPIVRKADVHRGMSNMGFPAGKLTVNAIRIEENRMTIAGMQRRKAFNYTGYDYEGKGIDIIFDVYDKTFSCAVPLKRVNDIVVIDAEKLLDDDSTLRKYPSYGSGYVVIKSGKVYNYDVINFFIIRLMNEIQKKLEKEIG